MKKSALIALVGVCFFLVNSLYYFIVNHFINAPWEHSWYETIGTIFQVLGFIAWCCVGQFFLTIFNKSK